MISRLNASYDRYGSVQVLVVRLMDDDKYEIISGNHRYRLEKEKGVERIMCAVVEVNDAEARLLAQTINNVHGSENPGLRAQVFRDILEELPQEVILSVLPDTASSFQDLASMGESDMADLIHTWQSGQGARLKHFTAQLTEAQMEVIEEAIGRFMVTAKVGEGGNPNRKGIALYQLCRSYLESEESKC